MPKEEKNENEKKTAGAATLSIDMFDSESEDQLTRERGRCLENDCDVRKYFLEAKTCTERVMAKIEFTAETCQQEMVDLVEAIDRCVKDIAFRRIL